MEPEEATTAAPVAPASTPRKKGRFTGLFKALLRETGVSDMVTTAAKENLKTFLVALLKGFSLDDKNAFEDLKVKVTGELEAAQPGMGVWLRQSFETWLASHPDWRQNCYKILVLAAPEDKRLGILKRMFQVETDAERDQVILGLFRDEPLASQLAENLRARWPWIFAVIVGIFGSVANFAANLPRLTGNAIRDFDTWLGTTASDAIEPYLTDDPARMGPRNLNRTLDELENSSWVQKGI